MAEAAVKGKPERNMALWMRHLEGASYRELGLEFGISKNRASQIVAKMERITAKGQAYLTGQGGK